MSDDRSDVVPRRMLELCKSAFRQLLARYVALERELAAARAELERLRRRER